MASLIHLARPTAQAARGRAIGCLSFIGFGTLWMCTGLATSKHGSVVTYSALALAAACLLGMTAMLFRRAQTLPVAAADSDFQQRSKRMFAAVNIIQWVSIACAFVILGILHLPEYIVPTIAIIVGLHLFPLAQSFRHRQHYVTGVLLIVWSLGALAVLSKEQVPGVGAIGTGLILLGSAVWTLVVNLVGSAGAERV